MNEGRGRIPGEGGLRKRVAILREGADEGSEMRRDCSEVRGKLVQLLQPAVDVDSRGLACYLRRGSGWSGHARVFKKKRQPRSHAIVD